jgi:hypothetical protein
MKAYKISWHGRRVTEKVKRSMERTAVGWGVQVSNEARVVVHRLTGTLSRSLNFRGPQDDGVDKVIADAGSVDWFTKIPYGIYEWARGGSHDYLTGPVRIANADVLANLAKALREEGLSR